MSLTFEVQGWIPPLAESSHRTKARFTMTLQARVSRLDDYSGELVQALQKLGIENSRGTLNRDEQLDFLADLRRALVAKDLSPLKKRGRVMLLLSLLMGGAAVFVPPGIPNQTGVQVGVIGLAVLCLAFSVWTFTRFFRRRKRDEVWLGRMEAAAAKGGTIFDVE